MPLDPTSGDQITLTDAQAFVKSFRGKFPREIKGSFIGANKVHAILAQDQCIGIRCYHGYDDALGIMNLVLVGVDTNERDMTAGIIMERLVPCPGSCHSLSPLYNV